MTTSCLDRNGGRITIESDFITDFSLASAKSAVGASALLLRLSVLPPTPNLTLIDRRKPKPPWSHIDTTFSKQTYIRWCRIDQSNAPRWSGVWGFPGCPGTDTLHRGTINCLNAHNISPEQLPASWFAASEIHLDGPEVDLVVQPNLPKIVAHEVPLGEGAGCLLGAHLGPFWVIRKNLSGRYGLLLATYGLGLKVLDSRTNRYRDIEIGAATVNMSTTVVYKMAVAQYQVADKRTDP